MRLIGTLTLTTLLATALGACGSDGGASPSSEPGGAGEASPTAPATSASPTTAPSSSGTTGPTDMSPSPSAAPAPTTLTIRAGEVSLTATLFDTVAARSLVDLLPVTVEMGDHGGVEKTGRLPGALDISEEPDGADPDPGQLGYYAPGQDLVLYYGDQGYFSGIVVLGELEGDVDALADLDDVTVTVEPG